MKVERGAFDIGSDKHDFNFKQSSLSLFSLGMRLEPSLRVHKRVRIVGVLNWSWVRFVAEMPTASGFELRANRAGVEMNWGLGVGASFEVIPDWVELNVSGTYNLASSQSGSAYDKRGIQAVVDGEITHLAPLPRLGNAVDLIAHLGFIF